MATFLYSYIEISLNKIVRNGGFILEKPRKKIRNAKVSAYITLLILRYVLVTLMIINVLVALEKVSNTSFETNRNHEF